MIYSNVGFQRRAGLKIVRRESIDNFTNPLYKEVHQESERSKGARKERLHHSSSSKFRIMRENRKDDVRKVLSQQNNREMSNIAKELEDRPASFYQLAFKTYEKQGKKALFKEIFDLSSRQMKGTMTVGELWSNIENSKYLKENRICVSKLKLMEQLKSIRGQIHRQRKQASRYLKQSSRTVINIQSSNTIMPGRCPTQASCNDMSQIASNMRSIQDDIKQLKRSSERSQLGEKVKMMEKCVDNMGRVEKSYFMKLIDMS